jgi:hypothetical protein
MVEQQKNREEINQEGDTAKNHVCFKEVQK